jgi:GNAT superfamily N-acetyltransferase
MTDPVHVSRAALLSAADDNLVVHASWVHQRTPGMPVENTPELVVVDSGLPCDTFNVVCRARLDPATAPARIRAAIDSFTRTGRPFSWWHGPADQPPDLATYLQAAGLRPAERELAMVANLAALPSDTPLPDGLSIQRVRTARQLNHFAAIVAAGWTPPDQHVLRFYARATPALLRPDAPLWLYVGYLGDVPVATAELTVGGGVVGLYNIITQPAYRRRGVGTAMTLQPLRDAHEQGATTAILQASDEGARVYSRVGFTPLGDIREFKPA